MASSKSQANGLDVFFSGGWAAQSKMASQLVAGLQIVDGYVGFRSFRSLDEYLRGRFGFGVPTAEVLRDGAGRDTGSIQWFYSKGQVLIRIKDQARSRRPESAGHMAVVIATGKSWDEEIAKVSSSGQLIPKLGFTNRCSQAGDWRTLCKAGSTTAEIYETEDKWADSAHFDFMKGFDWQGAEKYI